MITAAEFLHAPKMPVQVTEMPSLASTACTWSRQEVRSLSSLCRYAEARIMPGRARGACMLAVAWAETSA